MGLRIKKGDTAIVLTGKNKGKSGRVLSVLPSKEKLIIEGINIVKRHMKPSKKYTHGGIIEKEAPLHISNIMLICPKCNKHTRIGNTVLDNGKKLRTCRKCKEVID
ncbi:MAG: 50S ribosomal protein L24 [Thermodesulfovibrionales bacterium]|nr:50S ribosomal protein L24 [Thermodesulfovibrionales bacterium]